MLGHAVMVNDVDPTQINGRHGVNVRRSSLMVSNYGLSCERTAVRPADREHDTIRL